MLQTKRRERIHPSIIKVRGEDNVADGLTKQVEQSKMDIYMEKCFFSWGMKGDTSFVLISEVFEYIINPNGLIGSMCLSLFATRAHS